MIFDFESLQFGTREQFILLAHEHITKPSLILFFVGILFAFILSSLITNHTKEDWNKVLLQGVFFVVITSIIFGLIFFLPMLTQNIVTWIGNIFTG